MRIARNGYTTPQQCKECPAAGPTLFIFGNRSELVVVHYTSWDDQNCTWPLHIIDARIIPHLGLEAGLQRLLLCRGEGLRRGDDHVNFPLLHLEHLRERIDHLPVPLR